MTNNTNQRIMLGFFAIPKVDAPTCFKRYTSSCKGMDAKTNRDIHRYPPLPEIYVHRRIR